MRPRANIRRPAILTRRLWSVIVRAIAITTMSFCGRLRLPVGDHRARGALRSVFVRDRRRGFVRRFVRRHRHPDFAHPPDEAGAAPARDAARSGGGPQLGNPGSAGARQELFRGARRRHRAPRRRGRDHLCQRRILRPRRIRARRDRGQQRSRCRSRSKATARFSPTAPGCTTRRSRPPKARAGSRGGRSACAPTPAARCKASAAT